MSLNAETQTETEHEINDGFVKKEAQSVAGVIGDVWVSGAGEKEVPRVKVLLRTKTRSASLQDDSMRMLCARSLY